ncbi:MAG: pilus assembly protein N-terminal domain-containing protein [Alphaproteobacteria bacterium]|nr:pilus assembly protein N-terminal domain-containing protein [Alphaproteobacteria bacterium]
MGIESIGVAQTRVALPIAPKLSTGSAAVAPPPATTVAAPVAPAGNAGSWAGVTVLAGSSPPSPPPEGEPEVTILRAEPSAGAPAEPVADTAARPTQAGTTRSAGTPPPAGATAPPRDPVARDAAPSEPPRVLAIPGDAPKPLPAVAVAPRPSLAQARPADVLGKAAGAASGAMGGATGSAKPAPKPPLPTAIAPPQPARPMPGVPMPGVPMPGVQPVSATTPTVQGDSGATIQIEINRGQVVRLPRPAATVFIANPEIADVQVKSPNLVYVFAKKGGETTLIAVDSDDGVMLESRVVVTNNHGRLRDSLRQALGDRERDVAISTVGEQLVLEGSVQSPADAENVRRLAAAITGDEKKIINRLKVSSPTQVMLRVRVAEMSKDVSKQLGFNWNVVNATDAMTIGFTVLNPNQLAVPNNFRLTATEGATTVQSIIDALEEDRLVKILAQPNLTAMSGQTASFLVGGEFPILVPQGNGAIGIEFKTFGVSLAFQPTVLSDNRMSLHVRPEVSELSDQGAISIGGLTIPALQVRRAETIIEIASGQSFAIAGLLRNDVTHSISKWPGLADIPILGTLFRSDLFQRRESELIIIVTPYLVEPVANNKVAAPTDGFQAPHDVDRIFYGAQWRRTLQPGNTQPVVPQGRLAGPAGFQLE